MEELGFEPRFESLQTLYLYLLHCYGSLTFTQEAGHLPGKVSWQRVGLLLILKLRKDHYSTFDIHLKDTY